VTVLPPCIQASHWDNRMEWLDRSGKMPELALRLGFRQIKGIAEEEARWITGARGNGYQTVEDVWRRAGVGPAVLSRLAEADAFAALGLSRRDALWAAAALAEGAPLPLFATDMEGEGIVEPVLRFRAMTEGEAVVEDYVAMRLTLRTHPVALLRPWLDAAGDEEPSAGASNPRRRHCHGKTGHDRAAGECGRSAGSIFKKSKTEADGQC